MKTEKIIYGEFVDVFLTNKTISIKTLNDDISIRPFKVIEVTTKMLFRNQIEKIQKLGYTLCMIEPKDNYLCITFYE